MPWSSTAWCDFTEHDVGEATKDPGLICVSLGERGGPDYFTFGEDIREALRAFWNSAQSRDFRDVGRFSFKVMPLDAALLMCTSLRAEAASKLSLLPTEHAEDAARHSNDRARASQDRGLPERSRS